MSTYRIQILTTPRRNLPPLHRAAVYLGSRRLAVTQAWEHNAGCGMSAAMQDAQAVIAEHQSTSWYQAATTAGIASLFEPDPGHLADYQKFGSNDFTQTVRSRIPSLRPERQQWSQTTTALVAIASIAASLIWRFV